MRIKLLIQITMVTLGLIMLLPPSDGQAQESQEYDGKGHQQRAREQGASPQLPEGLVRKLRDRGAQVQRVASDGCRISGGHIKQIAFAPNGDWGFLKGKNGWSTYAPKSMNEALHECDDNIEIKQIAFAPNGGWIFLLGKNGWRNKDIPSGWVFDKLWELRNAGEEIKQVAFAPNGGCIILYGRNGYSWLGLSSDMAEKLSEFNNAGEEIKQVAFAPNGGWVILRGRGASWASNIPQGLRDKLWEFYSAGEEIKQVAFAPNSAWVILTGD